MVDKGATRLRAGQVKINISFLGVILGRSYVAGSVPILVSGLVLGLR